MAWNFNRYRYKGYTKIETDFEKKVKRFFGRLLITIILLIALAAAAITAGEHFGWDTPTWGDIYRAVGIGQTPPTMSGDAAESVTRVHFIDVGQADATLIEQNGHFALIDAGTDADASNVSGAIIDYLNAVGVKTLDLLLITHQHYDHIGAVPDVLEHFDVERVVIPDASKAPEYDGYTYNRILGLIKTLNIPCDTATVGSTYQIGDGTLEILFAGIDITDDSYNNVSVITMFEAEGMRYLSCGDAEFEEETALVDTGTDISANLYKAAHHGASTSNYYVFLEHVKPEYVVVSCGKNNSFGHPQPRAVQAFKDLGAHMLRTDEQGTIVVYVTKSGRLAYAETGTLTDFSASSHSSPSSPSSASAAAPAA